MHVFHRIKPDGYVMRAVDDKTMVAAIRLQVCAYKIWISSVH
jgi:hypothetical protein